MVGEMFFIFYLKIVVFNCSYPDFNCLSLNSLTMVGEMFLDRGEVGTTWSKPVQTNSTKLVVIDETPLVNKQASPITTCLEKHHRDMSPSSAEQLLMSPTPLSHHACHI